MRSLAHRIRNDVKRKKGTGRRQPERRNPVREGWIERGGGAFRSTCHGIKVKPRGLKSGQKEKRVTSLNRFHIERRG